MVILGQRGVLTDPLGERMRTAVGFRNVLVHEYRDVDDDIVRARLADLSDLESFVQQVNDWVRPG